MTEKFSKQELLENFKVTEDTEREPCEKEFTIGATKSELDQDHRVRVYSNIGSVMRNLLKNEHFILTGYELLDSQVISIRGTLPIGCVTLKSNPRRSTYLNTIFS